MGGGRYPFLVFVNFLGYCMIRVSEGKVHLGILIDSLERYRSLFYAALLLVSFNLVLHVSSYEWFALTQ